MSKSFAANPIANELKGSAWFRRLDETDEKKSTPPSKATSSAPIKASKKRSSERSVHETGMVNRTKGSSVQPGHANDEVDRAKRSTVQHPKKARTLRRAYDLYETQLTGLRRIRATRELSRDANVSMSELMREAVDLLLNKEGIS